MLAHFYDGRESGEVSNVQRAPAISEFGTAVEGGRFFTRLRTGIYRDFGNKRKTFTRLKGRREFEDFRSNPVTIVVKRSLITAR
jgi:hypothetical protein